MKSIACILIALQAGMTSIVLGQLVASSQVIDLGTLDDRVEKNVVIPIFNQTGSVLKFRPIPTQSGLQPTISPTIENADEGELRFSIRLNGRKRINDRIVILTNGQDDPIEFRLKARFRAYGNLECPDFEKKKRMNNRAVYHTQSDQKQPEPIYLRTKSMAQEDFSDNPLIPASHLVLLVDASTSMQSNGRLEQIKSVMRQVVKSLRQQDEISIIKYNQDDEVILVKTSVAHEDSLIEIIDNIEPWGYTNGYEGIQAAIDLAELMVETGRTNHILLCSDGAFNVGEDVDVIQDLLMQRRKKFNFQFSVLSVGRNVQLASDLRSISNAGKGEFFHLKPNGVNSKRIKQILVRQLM